MKMLKQIIAGLMGIGLSFYVFAQTPQEMLFNTATAYWKSHALYWVTELDVARHLAKGPVPVQDLATLVGAEAEPLYRVMRALAAEGIFNEFDGKAFGLTQTGRCLQTDSECSMRDAILLYGSYIPAWSKGGAAIKTPEEGAPQVPFVAAFGKPVFEHLKENPAQLSTFQNAMGNLERQIYSNEAILSSFVTLDFKRVVDLGGGDGLFLEALLKKIPFATGELFDLPKKLDQLGEIKKNRRITFTGGDFFQSVPAGGDLYVLKRVLHDWTDEQAVVILRNILKVIPTNGKVWIIEFVLDSEKTYRSQSSEPANSKLPYWVDLQMMMVTGGKERTRAEFEEILKKAGFAMDQVKTTEGKLSIISATPRN